jgi:hypothetical protein
MKFALTVIATIKVALDRIGDVWKIIINEMKYEWLQFQYMISKSADTKAAILETLVALRNAKRGFMDDVNGLVARWTFELGGGLLRAAEQAKAAIQEALQPLSVGQLKAVTDHGAVTRESEKAFSMLNSTRGVQDYYQRLMADQQRDANGLLRDIRGEIRNAPAIRRARL